MLSAIMLSVIMLNVTYKPFVLSVVMPSVVMLNVVAPLDGPLYGVGVGWSPFKTSL